MNRKEFVRNASFAAAAFVMPGKGLFAAGNEAKVKIGLIGTGLRGQNHLELLLQREDVDLVSICDINDKMLASAKEIIAKSGKKMPEVFTGNANAWKNLVERKAVSMV